MARTCTKEFTVTIEGGTTVYAYYKCEEPNFSLLIVDEVGVANLTSVGAGVNSVAGIIGNGFDLGSTTPFIINGTDRFLFLAHDFTVRAWVKWDYAGSTTNIITNHPSDYSYRLRMQTTGILAQPQWTVYDAANVAHSVSPAGIIAAGWHHVVAWCETGVEIGMVIDGGAPSTTSFAGHTIYDPANPPFEGLRLKDTGGFVGNHEMDEVAVWNRKLSLAEIAADYNGGVGKTYPDVP